MKKYVIIFIAVFFIFNCATTNKVDQDINDAKLKNFYNLRDSYNSQDIYQFKDYINSEFKDKRMFMKKIEEEFDYFDNINLIFIVDNKTESDNQLIVDFHWEKNCTISATKKDYLRPTDGTIKGYINGQYKEIKMNEINNLKNATGLTYSNSGHSIFTFLKDSNNEYKLYSVSGDKVFGL